MSGDVCERALILAPSGRDGPVAKDMLAEAGIRGDIVSGIGELVEALQAGAGCGVITEEALSGADLHPLSEWLHHQPEWSDFPFVLLTQRGGGLERNPEASRYLEVLGNVTFLERPFHPTTFVSLAQSALRGRRRQYEARSRLISLRDLNETLEKRISDAVAERAYALAQLHEAQKLETIGQLTGGVAHDINNLLTPIMGALDLVSRRYVEADGRTKRLLDGALQSADRAKTLVNRLLGFARRQALETRAVDMGELLEGMRDLIVSSIGSAIELNMVVPANLPPALTDPNQLELAVLNLCVNSRDAMPEGGRLTIVAERAAIGPGGLPQLKPGAYVRLSVIDTGVGMDTTTLNKAIEPFFSTKGLGKGTGLGLSMVHGFAAQLGGAFSMTSEVGEGTRSDLYLPIAEAAAEPAVRLLSKPVQVARHLTLLLVDDEDLVRAGTAEMLRELGHTVHEASGGPEALNKLRSGLEVDAVITDYMMPRMNGVELADGVRELLPDARILVITGYAGGDLHLDVPQLSKPFRQADIAQALERLVDSNSNVLPLRHA